MAKLAKWEIPHVRKIDKDCKGRPKGFAFPPLPVGPFGVLGGFTIFTNRIHFRPADFNILPFLSTRPVYHFTRCYLFLPFIYLLCLPFPCVSTPGAVGVNIFTIFCAPYRLYHFTFLPILPFYRTGRVCHFYNAYRPPALQVLTFLPPCAPYWIYHFYHSHRFAALSVVTF